MLVCTLSLPGAMRVLTPCLCSVSIDTPPLVLSSLVFSILFIHSHHHSITPHSPTYHSLLLIQHSPPHHHTLQNHSCILHSIIGWDCILGAWSRIEGYPSNLNPNDPLAHLSTESLFNDDGRLNPSITVIGKDWG